MTDGRACPGKWTRFVWSSWVEQTPDPQPSSRRHADIFRTTFWQKAVRGYTNHRCTYPRGAGWSRRMSSAYWLTFGGLCSLCTSLIKQLFLRFRASMAYVSQSRAGSGLGFQAFLPSGCSLFARNWIYKPPFRRQQRSSPPPMFVTDTRLVHLFDQFVPGLQ